LNADLLKEIETTCFKLVTEKGSKYEQEPPAYDPEFEKAKEEQLKVFQEIARKTIAESGGCNRKAMEILNKLGREHLDRLNEACDGLSIRAFMTVTVELNPNVDKLPFEHGNDFAFKDPSSDLLIYWQAAELKQDGKWEDDFLQIEFKNQIVYASQNSYDYENEKHVPKGWHIDGDDAGLLLEVVRRLSRS
jgi:hypothetical protein